MATGVQPTHLLVQLSFVRTQALFEVLWVADTNQHGTVPSRNATEHHFGLRSAYREAAVACYNAAVQMPIKHRGRDATTSS